MPNFASKTNSHNKKILNENIAKPTSASCKCRVKASCPLDGSCLQSSLVYICKTATPKIINNYSHYIGLTENTFKPIQAGGGGGVVGGSRRGWGAKESSYQFFSCSFYKSNTYPPKLSEFQFQPFRHTSVNFKVTPSVSPKLLNLNQDHPSKKSDFSGQILIKLRLC